MNRSQGRPAAPPGPGQGAPRGASAGPPKGGPRAQNRGCIGSIFMDITGISFLAGMKKRLGGPGFAVALLGVLLFMFIIGAKIERYGHLGEHPYVMQILPAASCFSPILALLMTFAFAVGDCLTNATYWLFPQSSFLNMYTLAGKAHPLLTWGAYARMDFLTLPIYALLPGMGSRILYTVASRLFQAGRAKIVKDGGSDGGGAQKELDEVTKEQQKLAGRERDLLNRIDASEGKMASAQERRAALGQKEEAAAESVQRSNAVTKEANARARAESEAAAKSSSDAQQTKAMADEMGRAKASAERGRDQAADAVAASEDRGRQLGPEWIM